MNREFKRWPLNEKYCISNYGEVWSYKSNKLLTPYNRKDYKCVGMGDDCNGKRIQVYTHRMVAMMFLPKPCPQYLRSELWEQFSPEEQWDYYDRTGIVDHIDGDRSNPRLDNLRWTTHADNYKNSKYYIENHA
tara:strand:+ start:56 stop:454 length:399 start_codon:yes stop_codon:yes gene_type:complete